MEHLDEGTVHAWIDSELSAAQSAEVDEHVRTCEACAALVAEARGFVAASARIVAQLDQVPADVIPAVSRPSSARRRAARVWWRHPALAVAAALSITTLSWLTLRDDVKSVTAVAPTPLGDVASTAAARAPATPRAVESAPPAAAPSRTAVAPTDAPSAMAKVVAAREQKAEPEARDALAALSERSLAAIDSPRVALDASRVASRASAERARGDMADRAVLPAPPAAPPAPTTASALAAAGGRGIAAGRVGLAQGAASAPASASADARANTMVAPAPAKSALAPSRESLMGCYVLESAQAAARSATLQLPSRLRLTDSVRARNGETPTFLAYGLREASTAIVPLQYRRESASIIHLSPMDGDAVSVRVSIVGNDGSLAGVTGAEFVARRQPCP